MKKIIGIFVLVSLIISFSIPIEQAEKEILAGWWNNWSRDKNHNGIDDLIDEKIALESNEKISIFVDYIKTPTSNDIKNLENLGLKITYIGKYINTICVNKVQISNIIKIRNIQNVVMIEEDPIIYPLLDVGNKAIKARESGEYSPNTAYDLGYTGNGVNIAIIDTGVDDDHESLQGKFIAGVDFTDNSPWASRDGSTNPDDRDGHGTHCAGIAMGTGGNDGTYKGVAYNSRLIDVKVLSDIGAGGYLMQGIEWCIEHKDDDWGDSDPSNDGIDVLSISAGSFTADDDGQSATSRAANSAVERGLVVVAAIGNNGNDHQGISSPAAADYAIAVGATDDQNSVHRGNDVIADYSNSGPREDDGDDDKIDELKPEIVAPGSNINSCRHAEIGQQGVGYVEKSGTSMSTPFVAGVAALILQADPEIKPLQLKEIIKETAEQRGEPYDTNLSAKYNLLYGWGIVDAYEALNYLESGEKPAELNCNINSPKDGDNITGIIEIAGTAKNSMGSIDKVEIKIGDNEWVETIGINNWKYIWDTFNDTDGSYFIQARAITENKEAIDSINIIVNNTGGKIQKDVKEWYEKTENISIMSGICIAVVFLAIIVTKKNSDDK